MPVYNREQGIIMEQNRFGEYTWLINHDKNLIAIADGTLQHVDLAKKTGLCPNDVTSYLVFDGCQLLHIVREGWFIPADVTFTTVPIDLQDLTYGTGEYVEAFKAMRAVSAQMLANSLDKMITAAYPDDTSALFFPEGK